ncbi:hypothetical protein DRO26_01195 [Candidatus Bathyarchaeota archaeon]|nr:MAG: hypothetical protein DRO26_01195 [Candidatus Bathyarchaeota archaeon]
MQFIPEAFYPLFGQLSFGGLLGFFVGYASKKLLKLLIVSIGVFFAALLYLSYIGFIEIHYEKIMASTEGFLRSFMNMLGGGFSLPVFLTANIPFLGSFLAGFGLGFKVG